MKVGPQFSSKFPLAHFRPDARYYHRVLITTELSPKQGFQPPPSLSFKNVGSNFKRLSLRKFIRVFLLIYLLYYLFGDKRKKLSDEDIACRLIRQSSFSWQDNYTMDIVSPYYPTSAGALSTLVQPLIPLR